MKLISFSVGAVFISLTGVSGSSDTVDFSKFPWIAPRSTDLRGPCPGLNTLANHGFLPRNGQGLTIQGILQAALEGYNIQPEALGLAARVGITCGPTLNSDFTLADIRLHNCIEHDASVSRADFFTGDNFHFNETIFTTLANSNPGVDYYNTTSAGEVQRLRLLDSQNTNPTVINTRKEFGIRSAEAALYLSVMGNATTGVAPKTFVQTFFREERLPIAEGWKRSPIEITNDMLENISHAVMFASSWTANATQVPTITFATIGNNTTTL